MTGAPSAELGHDDDAVVRIIVLGASRNEAEAMLNPLRKAGLGVRPAQLDDPRALPGAMAEQDWDLLLFCSESEELPPEVEAALESGRLAVIVLADDPREAVVARHLARGAGDVLARGRNEHLLSAVHRELAALSVRRRSARFERMYWESERRCRSLLASSRDAIAYIVDGMHVSANPPYLQLLGYDGTADLRGLPVLDLVSEEDGPNLRRFLKNLPEAGEETREEFLCTNARGERFRGLLAFSRATFDGENCYQLVVQDLSQQEALEAQLNHLRWRDRLTGLFHRERFRALLDDALGDGSPERAHLVIVELENFRLMRQSVGITASDEVVRELCADIVSPLRERDVAARVGDHTLALLLMGWETDPVRVAMEGVRAAVQRRICVAAHQSVATTCSIGILTVDPRAGRRSADELLALADDACREAIRGGGNRLCLHRAAEPDALAEGGDGALEAEIPALLAQGRLALAFQPIVNLRGRSEEWYEVLLRAHDRNGARIPTGELFAAAVRCGMATTLDQWVIARAIETAERSRSAGRTVRLSVKLSEHAMRDEAVPLYITKTLGGSSVDPRQIVFQLDESTASGQVKMAQTVVNLLKRLNCPTALEHFGTDRGSLNTLSHLDVDYLKLDASILERLAHSPQSQETVRSIQQTALSLRKHTIATAVQDADSLAILWQCGIDFAQGHYIQEPAADLSYEFSEGGDG